MKKLSIRPNIASFDLTEPKFITLVIESKKEYLRVSQYCYDSFPEHEGIFEFIDDDKTIDMDDIACYIHNPLNLDINTKQNLNSLYKILKRYYFEQIDKSLTEIQEEVEKICKEIRLDFDAELTVTDSIKPDDIFKISDLRFADEDLPFLERLSRYIIATHELRGIDLVIINHLRDYLENEDIEILRRELSYHGVSLLNIESSQPNIWLPDEEKTIIDNDLCVIK